LVGVTAATPRPLLEFSLWYSRRHRTLSEELKEVSGIDNQFRVIKRLTLALDEDSVIYLKDALEWQRKVKDYDPQWLEPSDVLKVEPRLNLQCLGGTYIDNASSVEPYRYILATAQAAEKLGVEIMLRRVNGLLTQGDRCSGVTFDNGQIEAEMVVLYLGTGGGRKGILWSTGMCQGLVDLIFNRSSDVPDLEHLDISRFKPD
jgi:glycine/D-amino acid oxidase-like deaminating enzyme